MVLDVDPFSSRGRGLEFETLTLSREGARAGALDADSFPPFKREGGCSRR